MDHSQPRRSPIEYLIGILILGVVIWQLVGYLIPDRQVEPTTEEFLTAMLKAQGGLQNWQNIDQLSFTKSFQLYDSLGQTEINRLEKHSYSYSNGTSRLIQWKQDQSVYNIVERSDTLFQLQNGHIDTSMTSKALRSKIDAAAFVIGLPFSLITPEATLDYKGIDSLYRQEVYILEAKFKNSEDLWQLYFATKDYTWVGYWVHTNDHFSLVLNDEMTAIKGFMLPRKRKSYRTTALRDTTYLRATYTYENYTILP